MEIGCHGCLLIFRIHWPTFSFYKQVIYVWFANGKHFIHWQATHLVFLLKQTNGLRINHHALCMCTLNVLLDDPFCYPVQSIIRYQQQQKMQNLTTQPIYQRSTKAGLYTLHIEKNRIILYYYYYYITSISAIKLPFYYYMYVACCIALFSGKVSSLLLPLLLT